MSRRPTAEEMAGALGLRRGPPPPGAVEATSIARAYALDAERVAHGKTRRDLRVALVVLVVNTVLMIVFAVKYLQAVDLPKPRCLHPATFAPTHLELATVTEAPRQTV